MTNEQIKAIQKKIGAIPDGFWGPKSIAACQSYLRSLMPKDNPWPATNQEALTAFYGSAGDESRLVSMPIPDGVTVKYEGDIVKRVRCNERVAHSLSRVIKNIADTCPHVLLDYNGCYNNRAMRGGSLPSLHARGAAIDFMAGTNGNHTPWPVASDMPLEAMECFAREGWIAAGAFWGRDAMHFQATR